MAIPSSQGELFAAASALPEGLVYRPGFIDAAEEQRLLRGIAGLPLRAAQYRTYVARRRIAAYGASYDFSSNELHPAPPLPAFLEPLRAQIGAWLELPSAAFQHALVTEYEPGTPIGWHRDTPDFELVVGISLLGACRMRFRPYPHVAHRRDAVVDVAQHRRDATVELTLEPRSAYVLRGAARWRWQHHIPPAAEHRYSITFRTLAARNIGASRRPRREPTI